MNFKISKHANDQILLRGIERELVFEVLKNPDNIIEKESCKYIFQKIITEGGKKYLYRIFVNVCKEPLLVITAYKTSKIEKYEN